MGNVGSERGTCRDDGERRARKCVCFGKLQRKRSRQWMWQRENGEWWREDGGCGREEAESGGEKTMSGREKKRGFRREEGFQRF